MVKPNVLVLTGYGINCDEETQFAFEKAGANAECVHINDIIEGHKKLQNYQILAFPGGFSYGDDTGAGNALANKIRNHLWDDVESFVEGDHLTIGICNGFQVMANLGLLPAIGKKYGDRQVALVQNDLPRYLDRWVDLEFSGDSPWVKGLEKLSFPIAHGEGKFYCDTKMLQKINEKGLIAVKYIEGNICREQKLETNPNGSLEDIAGITDESGKLFGIMPHPERAIEVTQFPDWTLLREKHKRAGLSLQEGKGGLEIFKNGVNYFK